VVDDEDSDIVLYFVTEISGVVPGDRNINSNESKFETTSSSSMSQSTDGEGISLSSDSTHPSPSGAHYNQMISELKDSIHKNVTENGHWI
jgi:hypothetical protein